VQEKNSTNPPALLVVIPVRNSEELREWQQRMGFSYSDAAAELGVNRSTYAAYLTGKSRATGFEVALPRAISLAAMAIEAGLNRALPHSAPQRKKAA
jgi:transcriptional regulator with XRE-family HTH domain